MSRAALPFAGLEVLESAGLEVVESAGLEVLESAWRHHESVVLPIADSEELDGGDAMDSRPGLLCSRRRAGLRLLPAPPPPPLPHGRSTSFPALAKCNRGERKSIFTSPLSSRCKMPLLLPRLLEVVLVMHSVAEEAFMRLHRSLGVSLSIQPLCRETVPYADKQSESSHNNR
jgi:hypothetical protein